MTPVTFVYLIAGLALLVAGAVSLLRGCARLTATFGLPLLPTGLALLASAPAIAVGLQAAASGHGDIAVGGVLGGSLLNLLWTLGLSALIAPLAIPRQLIRCDLPLLIGACLLSFALAHDGVLSALDGALLCAGALGYCAVLLSASHREKAGSSVNRLNAELGPQRQPYTWQASLTLLGLGGLLLAGGAYLLVNGAVILARSLGLSELMVGLTLIAVGTALPQFAYALLTTLKAERDSVAGSLIGSALFNLLAVLGLAALVAPQPLSISPNALAFDFPALITVALVFLPICFFSQRINRLQGLLLAGCYLAYSLHLLLFASGAPALGTFRHAMRWYFLPLIALALALLAARAWHKQRRV